VISDRISGRDPLRLNDSMLSNDVQALDVPSEGHFDPALLLFVKSVASLPGYPNPGISDEGHPGSNAVARLTTPLSCQP
jgi:hypothetical protein